MAKATKVLDITLKSGELMAQLVIWRLPAASSERPHGIKYRLWCGRSGETRSREIIVRYDNEAGKGDHRHYGNLEGPYTFVSVESLVRDFSADVKRLTGWRME